MTTPAPVTPWTRRQLITALRRAGWKRMSGPAAVYVSPSGVHFQMDAYVYGLGILWEHYAVLRVLPG